MNYDTDDTDRVPPYGAEYPAPGTVFPDQEWG